MATNRGIFGGGGRRARRLRAVLLIGVAVAVVAVLLVVVPKGTNSPGGTTNLTRQSLYAGVSTSTAGITGSTIRVVFPVIARSSTAGKEYTFTKEFLEQKKAISFYVGRINRAGGIDGKHIKPVVVTFTPLDQTEMASLCRDWTSGTSPAFAVLDPVGTWTGTHELCVTKYGHVPMIAQWSTVSTWTTGAAPYLWWLGADISRELRAVVSWGIRTHHIGGANKVGILLGSTTSDGLEWTKVLEPALAAVGVHPVVETVPASPTATAATDAEAPLALEKLRAAGVTSLIPLAPENVLEPFLQAEDAQAWYPTLLMSDNWTTIDDALGLLPIYKNALQGQEGITTETLGGADGPQAESKGGYDPAMRACWVPWHKKYPNRPFPTSLNDVIEEQGPVGRLCVAITIFAKAARAAGANLNRRTFVEAMAHLGHVQGGISATMLFGPTTFAGPTKYHVVKVWTNKSGANQCVLPYDPHPTPTQPTCWVDLGRSRSLPK